MGAWGTSIFSDDLAIDIRREYSVLLSVGKTNEEAEKMLINYYSSILNSNDPDEDVFWFALALSEWRRGRLSSFVKEQALFALQNGRDIERWTAKGNERNCQKRKKTLNELENILLSPMPSAKKIKKPTVHHCPWKVGSLLAYRIVSNKRYLKDHPCYEKYVLLRVVRIDRHPISKLFDTGYYDETMMVGLYDWIGNELPDPLIVHDLRYTPIKEYPSSKKHIESVDLSLLDDLPEKSREMIKESISSFFERSVEKCVWLDWRSTEDEHGDITLISCDDDFVNNIPEFFQPKPTACTYTHFWTFDMSLSKKFLTQGTVRDQSGAGSLS